MKRVVIGVGVAGALAGLVYLAGVVLALMYGSRHMPRPLPHRV